MTEVESRSETARRRAGLPLGRLALVLALLAGVAIAARAVGDAIPRFAAFVEGLGFWGPAVFVAGYALAVVAFVPASLMTLAAGALFGVARGTLYVFVAATIGSCLAFLVSRYLARAAIERRLEADPRFAAIDRAIGAEGRKIVFLLRLSPIFPFNLLNYALGLTRVRFADYAIAAIGMLPGTLLYVYSGMLAGDLAALAGGVQPERSAGATLLQVVGLAATLVATLIVTRIARRALTEATGT
jgi:uncharacterized membrane protein YdjX (TVP38/TMEM64 family)